MTEYQKHRANLIAGCYGGKENITKSENADQKEEPITVQLHDDGMADHVKQYNAERKGLIAKSYSNAETILDAAVEDDRRHASLIKKSIETMIEKGEVSDSLGKGYGYGSEPLKFKKTGAQIKEKLPAIITSLTAEQMKVSAQMEVLVTAIGIAPTEERQSSFIKAVAYKQYPWKMCEAPYNETTRSYDERTNAMEQCSQYNSLAWLYCSLAEDIASCQVILSNVEDKTSYTLSTSQLVSLGF